MRKYIYLAMGILTALYASSQSVVTFPENFDGNTSTFTSSPASAWKTESNYYVSPPNGIRGTVPNLAGDSVVLLTPVYNLSNYGYVLFRFNHICKVSPQDSARVEYRVDMGGGAMSRWEILPVATYLGKADYYTTTGFNANTYPEWMLGDSLALPSQSWWKEELFDLWYEAGHTQVQFRFILKHGNATGSQIAYGWLIDNVEIEAAPYEIKPPVVEFLAPFIRDTTYSLGPHIIHARVETQTVAPVETPWLIYTVTNSQGTITDSVLMTHVYGNSLWEAAIPQFVLGSEVVYSITGRDATGNTASIVSSYVIVKPDYSMGNVSAALTSVVSPVQGQTMGNAAVPIEILLRNKGDSTLTSATIHRSINGVDSAISWTGNLLWDAQEQVSLGTYQPRMEEYDTIVAWVSAPNGLSDPVLSDDTVFVITYGCSMNMSGTYAVGNGELFSNMEEALSILKFCHPAGDITLALKSGEYLENWEISNTDNFMGNHTLTITSLAGNKDSVILRPPSGVGIRLFNANNLIVKSITVDVVDNGTYGIEFGATCTNVVISHCNILGDTINATLATAHAPIYMADGTGISHNISITNNILSGGYYGIFFNAGTGTGRNAYGTNILIDSNMLMSQAGYAVYGNYTDFTAISNNQIMSRTTSATSIAWNGITLSRCNGKITGNRIFQRDIIANRRPCGIDVQYFNFYNTFDTGVIANNEISLCITAGPYQAMNINTYTIAKVLHNSIYVLGSSTAASRGINIINNASNYIALKNNNIVMDAESAHPVYLSPATNLHLYDMDYNNMYAPKYVGYAGGNKETITEWQQTVLSDLHSVRVLPEYTDPTHSLKMPDYLPIRAAILPDVNTDIENDARGGAFTAMGCYHGFDSVGINARLGEITGLREGVIFGQSDTIRVELFNMGTTPLTATSLNWSINGTTQSGTGIKWSGSLAQGQYTSIDLGKINYVQTGYNVIRVWIEDINPLTDPYKDDDTASLSGYICSSAFNGSYTIGNGGLFSSYDAAMEEVMRCGVGGNVIFEFLPDTYRTSINLTNSSLLFGDHTLTLTSSTGNAEDVVIIPPSGIGIVLSGSNRVRIKNITVDATEGMYAIQFAMACTNVIIRDCRLLVDTATTALSIYPISAYAGLGGLDSIFIINNLLDGGYAGIYAQGSLSYNNTNMVIDSNTFQNNYYYSLYMYYNRAISVSYNKILSRTANQNQYWYGIYGMYAPVKTMSSNRIKQQSSMSSPTGIYYRYQQNAPEPEISLITNNEIIMDKISSGFGNIGYGINTGYGRLKILHNSIYMGTAGGARGISLDDAATNRISVNNNNIVITASSAGYPIYLTSINNLSLYDMDYNNMFAPQYVGYAGGNKVSIADWQESIRTDKRSVRIEPEFIDETIDLQLSGSGLECPLLPEVSMDINGNTRMSVTTMGCHQETNTYSVNGRLIGINDGKVGYVGIADTFEVILINVGTSALTEATLNWSINGVLQSPPITVSWTGTLPSNSLDTVRLGIITPLLEEDYTIKIWISALGLLQDEFTADDTVSISGYNCSSSYAGTYTVGTGESFTSIKDFLDKIKICGVTGDITLELLPERHQEDVDLANLSLYMKNYTFTLTSQAGNVANTIVETQTAGIQLSTNSNNIIIRDITIDARTNNTYSIRFLAACSNIVITNCIFLADTSGAYPGLASAPILKANMTGIADNVSITNNIIEGGYYGIYFFAGTGTNAYGKNIVIDNNTIRKQGNSGINSQYTDFKSISNNNISSRTHYASASWNGIYLYYCNGDVLNNRILQRSNDIFQPYGIYLQSFNQYSATDTTIIANNDIIVNTTATYGGIYANATTRAKIVNNSIYVSGSGDGRGIGIANNANNYVIVKNNNIVMESADAYPVYLNATTNLNAYNMDYNNMYAPVYVGYAAANKPTMLDWQQTVTTDKHSVAIRPVFIDSSINLELSDYTGLSCPIFGVTHDINGYIRADITTMGAYNGIRPSLDLGMEKILCNDTAVSYPQLVPVSIEIVNMGSSVSLDSATFGWSLNGELQPPYTWIASPALAPGSHVEISIGSFSTGKSNHFDILVWVESVHGRKDSIAWNDTAKISVQALCTGSNLSLQSIVQLVPTGILCTEDYTSLKVVVDNTGTLDYDFAVNPTNFGVRVTNPVPFNLDTFVSLGEIKSGEIAVLELTDIFPIMVAGIYDIEIFLNSAIDIIRNDDTIRNNYISGRFGLPIDEDFSNGVPMAFVSNGLNSAYKWDTISQGTGADTAVIPQFGTSILAFKGSPGSMATLSTQQLDLSQTVKPALSFWYFHDTVPCEDYTDIRITVDGGTTYNTLFSLTKYNPVYGWRQYSMDLPPSAINQCVILTFEGMEKSRNGDVTQYIDRILITARQDITISEIITSELTACDLEGKEIKVVLTNLTDPVLDFGTTPVTLTLEILGIGQTYTHLLDSGSLGRFASDTISMTTGIDFTKGTHTLKAYFSSVLDVDRMNDTLVRSIIINPELSVSIHPESSPASCLTGELVIKPTITLYNTGNMDLSGIDMILQIDTGESISHVYTLFKETDTGTILAGDTADYLFNGSFTVPWNARYDVRTYVYLSCDSALANSTNMVQECVDIKDLRIISIDNPSATVIKDAVGSSIPVTVTSNNRSDGDIFTDIPVNVRITNSQGIEQETFMETQTIGASATVSHTFSRSYTVPNDTVYYLTVFVNGQDNYSNNDTLIMKRYTESVGIETLKSIGGFTLYQNIPNPANKHTHINYSIPEVGEVVFYVHSVSGQLLYSQTIEATHGKQSLELNTSSFAAGIYFYSIEYKGQRLVKRMMISD